jgi:hypothetical protein
MNIKHTMCRLSDLTNVQVDSLVDNGPREIFTGNIKYEKFIGFHFGGDWATWTEAYGAAIVTYTEMMQLLGKTMKEFTKSDLKAGVHFVKDRNGVFYAVCRNTFCGLNRFVRLSSFNDELVNVKGNSELDIIEVYETDGDRSMSLYLQGLWLKSIWERTEQTEAQKEMEVLLTNMVTLEYETKSKMEEIQKQIKVVQAKL